VQDFECLEDEEEDKVKEASEKWDSFYEDVSTTPQDHETSKHVS